VPEAQITILCVDDEHTALYFRKLVLEKGGFHVITASSAKEALEILAHQRVDVVLSDVLMPITLGTELAKLIKEQYPTLPVVLISGVNEIPTEASHADLFISKLEGPAFLCERIRTVLRQNSLVSNSD
jgi:CheY-like chemotaxis protein